MHPGRQEVKCAEFLKELTDYLDGVIDDRTRAERGCPLERGVEGSARGHDAVDEPERGRFVGFDVPTAPDEILRPRRAEHRAGETEKLRRERGVAERQEARAARRGLWVASPYVIRSPRSLAHPDLGTFQIIEGKVLNAAVSGGRAYLNFGRNWRTDFTVTISPQDMKSFKADGIDPRKYAGKVIRVRGWIERLNGPEIEVAVPEAIEVLPGSSAAPVQDSAK